MRSNPFQILGSLYTAPELQEIRDIQARWMENTYAWVDGVLTEHPLAWPEPPERRHALLVLDEPLHVLTAPLMPALNDFLNRRIARTVDQIEREVVTHGATIWKLYNHSFVVKTPELTLGFDLHRGPFDTFAIAPEIFDRLLQATEALFISHAHSDHADADAIPRMVELGRPVIVPPGLWEGAPVTSELITPERHWKMANRLALNNAEITYRIFPGHQGYELLNNVVLVELPQGLRIMHTGDQANVEDFGIWIDRVHEQFQVDVLLPNCWTTDLPRMIQGVAPRLVITGHENEMSHSVSHREAFVKTYTHIIRETTPVLVGAWGERYHYDPDTPLPPRSLTPDDVAAGPLQGLDGYLQQFV